MTDDLSTANHVFASLVLLMNSYHRDTIYFLKISSLYLIIVIKI